MENEKLTQASADARPSPTGAHEIPREDTSPLSAGDYVVMFILFCLPVVNLVLALVWGFGSSVNLNRRNFAKAFLILWLVMLILGILSGLVMGLVFRQFMPMIEEFFSGF